MIKYGFISLKSFLFLKNIRNTLNILQQTRTARKQRFADRYIHALYNGDRDGMNNLISEHERFNQKMARLGREKDIIPFDEMIQMVLDRTKPDLPPEYMWNHFFEIREKLYGEKISEDDKKETIDFWQEEYITTPEQLFLESKNR